ncbi:MAG: SIR2 family NAD-dependent protein deacylase [Thermodesulfobacteriota bacterium]
MDKELIKKTARAIRQSQRTVALTGAGISVESGIPDFRGAGGLWEKYDPREYATIEAFLKNPQKVWAMLLEVGSLLEKSRPNQAHLALAKLEELGYLKAIITQNIDNLHQAAGSKRVIEFHGNGQEFICLDCRKKYSRQEINFDILPPRCRCYGLIKPNIVFFGEPIPWEALQEARVEAGSCDLMLVIGTSAVVSPACDLPVMAKLAGATVVEVNLEPTPLTGRISHWLLQGSASQIMAYILQEVMV